MFSLVLANANEYMHYLHTLKPAIGSTELDSNIGEGSERNHQVQLGNCCIKIIDSKLPFEIANSLSMIIQ